MASLKPLNIRIRDNYANLVTACVKAVYLHAKFSLFSFAILFMHNFRYDRNALGHVGCVHNDPVPVKDKLTIFFSLGNVFINAKFDILFNIQSKLYFSIF